MLGIPLEMNVDFDGEADSDGRRKVIHCTGRDAGHSDATLCSTSFCCGQVSDGKGCLTDPSKWHFETLGGGLDSGSE
eukprot:436080-Amphidinium_carterae.1